MTIDFGYIKSYNSDRGFGFVGSTFSNPNSQVFFHIRKIKSKYRELAEKLDNDDIFEPVSFWYEIETTQKGKQVSEVWLNKDDIPSIYEHQLDSFIEKVEGMWKNIESSKPRWLDALTINLLGVDRKDELSFQRNNLENQRREAEEEKLRVAQAMFLKQLEIQKEKERQEIELKEQINISSQGTRKINLIRQRLETLRERKHDQENEIEKQININRENEVKRLSRKYDKYLEGLEAARELHELLEEMRPKNFTHSKQLSNYIVEHRLGYKYKHISGILRMQNGTDEWDFKGGFPTDIYRIICQELNLDNQHTSARPKHFTPFKDILATDNF